MLGLIYSIQPLHLAMSYIMRTFYSSRHFADNVVLRETSSDYFHEVIAEVAKFVSTPNDQIAMEAWIICESRGTSS